MARGSRLLLAAALGFLPTWGWSSPPAVSKTPPARDQGSIALSNGVLDGVFGETSSETLNFKNPSGPKAGTKTDPLFLEHFAVHGLAAGGGIAESDTAAFTVVAPFEESGSRRTALLSLATSQGTIYVARHVFVPPGNSPYVVISYKILNPLDLPLPFFKFFQTADYDHYDTGSRDDEEEEEIEARLRAQGQEDPQVVVYEYQTDKARLQGNVVMIEDRRPTFPLGLTSNLQASRYGMDHWFIEDFEDWDDGSLNGLTEYPRPNDPNDTGILFDVGPLGMGDPSVGMQFDVPGIPPGGVFEVDMRLLLGTVQQNIGDVAIAGPEFACVHEGSQLGKMEEADGIVRLEAKAGGGSFVWSENDPRIAFVGPLKGGMVDVTKNFILLRGVEASTRRYDAEVLCTFTPAGGGGVDEAFHLMTVVEIESVKMEGIANESEIEEGGNPALNGGGGRIFPDKKTPTDGVRHDRVKVLVKTKPALEGIPVFLRAFDPDDPFDQRNASPFYLPPHEQRALDANRNKGDDNFGTPNRGTLEGADPADATGVARVLTDAEGKVERKFTVTQQPGDNFVLLASCSKPYLEEVKDSEDGFSLEDRNGNTISRPDSSLELPARSSELLTVWRQLHIERDSMSAVAGNFVTGSIRFLDNNKLVVKVSVVLLDGSEDLDSKPAKNGRFENGTLSVVGANQVGIAANGERFFKLQKKLLLPFKVLKDGQITQGDVIGLNVLANPRKVETILMVDPPVGDLSGGIINVVGANEAKVKSSEGRFIVAEGSVDPTFTAVDDDKEIFPDDSKAALPRLPDLGLMNPRYGDAYLEIRDDGGGDEAFNKKETVTFEVNASSNDPIKLLAIINGANALESHANRADDFWIVYVLSAYQGDVITDLDPDTEEALFGITIGTKGSLVFQETVSDAVKGLRSAYEQLTVVHEIGHQFKLGEELTGIMSPLAVPDDRFSGSELRTIRSKSKSPGSR